jgi:hypothetical protein
VSIAFLRRRTVVPRNRITASTAAAEVEEAQHVAVEGPAIPAQSTETPRQESNGGTRRRDANQNKRKKLPVKYKIEDLVVGQEVDGVVVRGLPWCRDPQHLSKGVTRSTHTAGL